LESSEIRLKLKKRSKGSGYLIPVDLIGNYLIKMQNLMYHCGEYISEKPFRARGHPSKDVVKRCRLLMKGADISSFDQTLVLGDEQTVLFGNQLGVDSIKLCTTLFDSLLSNNPETISKIVHESVTMNRYRNRILKDMDNLIPRKYEGIDLEFQSEELAQPIEIGYENKHSISKLIRNTKNEDISIVGILSEMRVTQGPKRIELTGPEGKIKIKYTRDVMETLIDLMNRGQPVNIKGIAKIREDDTIELLEKIKDISEIKFIERHRIVSDNLDIKLAIPLKLELKYSDDNWLMKNDQLGIFSQCKDYNECLKEAELEFSFIYNEYKDSKDQELTGDGKDLRNLLRKMTEEN
jgi:hypothetical protein